eukprot:scaffold162558_cov14-Tisochrysis_lutea.AAC.1
MNPGPEAPRSPQLLPSAPLPLPQLFPTRGLFTLHPSSPAQAPSSPTPSTASAKHQEPPPQSSSSNIP